MNVKLSKLLMLMLASAALSFALTAAISVNGQEQRKIPRGSQVTVLNSFGSIMVSGWNGETIEAVATDTVRGEIISSRVIESRSVPNKISVITGTNKSFPESKVKLEVKLPSYVNLELVETENGSITVSDMEGSVNAITGSGEIKIVNVGTAQVRTGMGNVNLENINGRTDLITTGGNISVNRITGDAKIIAVNAKINLSCVKGRVEIIDTSSQIQLAGIEGDVDVSTSNGKAYFTGAIRSGNHYRLKTLSGTVSMIISGGTGFSVTLSSYSGKIERDFDFQNESSSPVGRKERRFTGKYGDGKAQVELDSFDGKVSFSKISANAIKGCEPETKN